VNEEIEKLGLKLSTQRDRKEVMPGEMSVAVPWAVLAALISVRGRLAGIGVSFDGTCSPMPGSKAKFLT